MHTVEAFRGGTALFGVQRIPDRCESSPFYADDEIPDITISSKSSVALSRRTYPDEFQTLYSPAKRIENQPVSPITQQDPGRSFGFLIQDNEWFND